MPYYIYALFHPITEDVVYIGLTGNLRKRYKQHLDCQPGNEKKNAWAQALKDDGLIPSIKVIETLEREADARERELYWISQYLLREPELLNVRTPLHSPSKKPLGPLGQRIEEVRVKKGMPLTRLGSCMSYVHFWKVMHGQANISRAGLMKLCRTLGCTYEEATPIFQMAGYYLAPGEMECEPCPA